MAKKTTMLHEVLAVRENIVGAYKLFLSETTNVFRKGEHFLGGEKDTRYYDSVDAEKFDAHETKTIVTTVSEKLAYFLKQGVTKMVDVEMRIDSTNQKAHADVVVDGKVLIEKAPAQWLLSMENKLPALRELLMAIPTLQAGIPWTTEGAPPDCYKYKEPKVTYITKKVTKPVVLYPATDKHPAQVKESHEDINTAKVSQTVICSMWTSKQKADVLARFDALMAAIKTARQRANHTEVDMRYVGRDISKFLMDGPEQDRLGGEETENA